VYAFLSYNKEVVHGVTSDRRFQEVYLSPNQPHLSIHIYSSV
jgi:hypothetical protein